MSSTVFPASSFPLFLSGTLACRRWDSPGLFPVKGKWYFLRTSLRIFLWTCKQRRLFCCTEFSEMTENCLFCLSPLPRSVWPQSSSTPASAAQASYRQDCLFVEPLSFVIWRFCFSDSAQRGNLFGFYLQKSAL